jgi:hypothetical protein
MSTLSAHMAMMAQSSTSSPWYDVLFSSGEQGMVVDFNDLSTLFQDTAHSIPVTAAGDPIKSAQCKITGAYGVVNFGSATLAYDAAHLKYYADGDAAFNMSFAGAVPVSFKSNVAMSIVSVCGYTTAGEATGAYVGPDYPANPLGSDGLCLAQLNDAGSGIRDIFIMFGGGNVAIISGTPLNGVYVLTGTKTAKTSSCLTTSYLGSTLTGIPSVPGSNITAMNLNIGRGLGAAKFYSALIVNRVITAAEVAAYNVAGQAL